jgi:hypothetical protein
MLGYVKSWKKEAVKSHPMNEPIWRITVETNAVLSRTCPTLLHVSVREKKNVNISCAILLRPIKRENLFVIHPVTKSWPRFFSRISIAKKNVRKSEHPYSLPNNNNSFNTSVIHSIVLTKRMIVLQN